MVSILFLLLATLTATASLPPSSPRDFPIVGTSQRLVFQSLEEASDARGDSISVSYDARGLPVSHTGGRGIVTALKYNNDGLLTNVAYTATNTPGVRMSYDNRNRLSFLADGWSTNSYRYDAQGRMTNLVEVFGTSTQTWGYAFDALGRVTAVTWRITGNTNIFTTTYSFDQLGRVTNVASDLGNFGYAYTNAGLQVSRLTYPNGETAHYSYDSLARLTNLAYSTGERWNYAYDARDFVTRRIDPATNVYAYAYDEAGRLIEATGLKGTNIVSGYPYRYGYDRAGNRIRQTEGQKQRDLFYNANNQLLKTERTNSLSVRGYVNEPVSKVAVRNTASTNWYPATVRYLSQTQAYFEANNVLATNIYPLTNTILVRATDVANNVSTSTVRVVSFGTATRFYAYDADGNQAYAIEGASQKYATWDAENRLIRIDYTDGNSRFRYDGWGRLREIAEYNSVNTLTSLVRYAWNGFLPWAELNSTNGVIRTFTWGLDLSGTVGGAGGIGGLIGIRQNGTNYLIRGDGRGNVTEVRRTNGTVIASYGYSPFGQILNQTNTVNQSLRFQTRLLHARSGHIAWPLRWYSADTGTFMQRDRLGEADGPNVYVYVGHNPLSMADPLGLIRWGDLGAASWGLLGNGLGFAGGIMVGLIPEPTMATKIFAGVVVAKTGFGLGLNFLNAIDAIRDTGCPNQLPNSMANYIADVVAPGNETAQKISDIIDLSTDLGFMRGVATSVAKAPGLYNVGRSSISPVLRMAGMTDPTDLGRIANAYAIADYGRITYQNVVPAAVTSP